MSTAEKNFLKMFFSDNNVPNGYYVSIALYETYKYLESALRSLVDNQMMKELATFSTTVDTMLDLERTAKDYGNFKKMMNRLDINPKTVYENALKLAYKIGAKISDKCFIIEGRVSSLGLYIPNWIPCKAFYLNPYQSEKSIPTYPGELKKAIIEVWKANRLSEIFEKNVAVIIKHYKDELENRTDYAPSDIADALNFINENLVTNQLVSYMYKVKEDMEKLVEFLVKLQLLILPKQFQSNYVYIYNKYKVESTDNILAVAEFAQKYPSDFLNILTSKKPDLNYNPDFYNKNRLSDIHNYFGELRSLVLDLYRNGEEELYIGDPLFSAFYLLSSEPACEDCRTMASLITYMSPQEREEALAEIPRVKPLKIELSDNPLNLIDVLKQNSNLLYYISVKTNNQKIVPALTNLIKYMNAKKILINIAKELSVALNNIIFSSTFMTLFQNFEERFALKEEIEKLGNSWTSLDQQITNIMIMLQNALRSSEVNATIEAKLATVFKDGQEVKPTMPELTFDELKVAGFYSAGKKKSEDSVFTVYETALGEVHLTASANWFYETFKRSWSLNKMLDEVKKVYQIKDEATAVKVVEIFTNALIHSGIVVIKAQTGMSKDFNFAGKKEDTKVL